ncbi:MAG: putative PIN domain protein [Promethearchaeota archaeon]|nr:MAG: putative PIN domain protein [Candidatus Lokiarchaeota archaeon]
MKNNSIVIDTGVFIEFLEGSELGTKFEQFLLDNSDIYHYLVSPLVETELKYFFCRKLGIDEAILMIDDFLKDFYIYPESELRNEASRLKCLYPISLAVCYSISIATLNSIPVIFKKEKELKEKLEKLTNEAEIRFIEDI